MRAEGRVSLNKHHPTTFLLLAAPKPNTIDKPQLRPYEDKEASKEW
jgi:hypothetical protein